MSVLKPFTAGMKPLESCEYEKGWAFDGVVGWHHTKGHFIDFGPVRFFAKTMEGAKAKARSLGMKGYDE